MGSQLTRNLSLTFIMVIILTFIFVPNIQVTFHGVMAILTYMSILNAGILYIFRYPFQPSHVCHLRYWICTGSVIILDSR